ncbi:Sir2 family NAD-dependent protein deacetylase [Arcticibacterium luteifluviistationis]|uniref:NAD-dependent protein deacylase n=1 Tax=Arcticibacterium luteifluviistationis TaxID=1784714 RepID=A0A2Z4G8V6_9BACT|nr:Sir2 family NAD-dependent protein deacetylase [Arcticibacterium luteifluviistationis]AWV97621.1 NAD-dependent protein deacylase [Arcticibacterium luteifluviistationis]
MKKSLVVLTGAGISAESGLKTFRDGDGLWENHKVEDVATPEAFASNPALVLKFYNERRKAAAKANPNAAHKALAELEEYFNVHIITQNVDDLHERGGSSNVLHLHGELSKVRSERNPSQIFDIGSEAINVGDKAEDGSQLRPHIVWFGEAVPMIEPAMEVCEQADVFLVVGTSLQVYPAAGLIRYVPKGSPKYIIDKFLPESAENDKNIVFLEGAASLVLPILKKKLIEEFL